MEFFTKKSTVRLKSHLDKFLVADDDQQTVRQSRNGSSPKARWHVDIVDNINKNNAVIRLKSCHGRYLTASLTPYLLGMTGNKVLQTLPENMKDSAIEWQPIRDGFQVKLKGFGGGYLRGNGGTPPWRNSVTHDSPHTGSTQNWILWAVEGIDVAEDEKLNDYLSMVSSFSSVSGELSSLEEELGSPVSMDSGANSPRFFFTKKKKAHSISLPSHQNIGVRGGGMDLFHNAKAVRLKSHHDKYLTADEDEESVSQDRNGSAKNARWYVEFVSDTATNTTIIRLKSCYNKYLTASNQPFLLGMTGRKVVQSLPHRLDSSVGWEPIRDGNNQVKLRTRYGQFLRANGGLPPWRNSVTHDIPSRTATQEWIFWHVDVVEIVVGSPAEKAPPKLVDSQSSSPTAPSSSSSSSSFSRQESADSMISLPSKREDGRTIYYHIANEYGEVGEEVHSIMFKGNSIMFKGNGVEELTQRLEDETGISNLIVCSKSPLNGKLYPLRLQLPPNNVTMNVVLVQSSSKAAKDFGKTGLPL